MNDKQIGRAILVFLYSGSAALLVVAIGAITGRIS